MNHLLNTTRFCYAVLLAATIGLSGSGCRDSVSVAEHTVEVPLSSLTVTPGSPQPVFSSNTTSYLVEVSTTVNTITVAAIPKDSKTTMAINGVDTIPGQGRSITLSASVPTTTITIVLTSQNGLQSTYDVLVRKVDNTLSALSVTPPGTFPTPGFNPSTLTYQVEVASGVSSVAVVATKTDVHAVISGSVTAAAGVTTGKATVQLNNPGQPTVVSLTVAVPNGEAKTYTVTVNRLSSDNRLKTLTVTPGTFNHPFDPTITDYTVDVAKNIDKVTISATKSDVQASMSGNLTAGPGIVADTKTLDLGGQGTEVAFFMTVAAPDPTVSAKVYKVTVHRAASDDSTLSALIVTADSLAHPINLSTPPPYTVNVATSVTSMDVSATKSDPNAVMAIGSVTVPAGTASGTAPNLPLGAPGSDTPISVIVTAQNGVNSKTYPLTVHRALPSSDADLSNLTVTPGILDQPFNANIFAYTVISVPLGDTTVLVTATKSDQNATMSALGSVIAPPGTSTGTVTLQLGAAVGITVIAQDAVTSNSYTITFSPPPPTP